MKKVAVVLHAEPGTHDALGRALHALLYSQELKDNGHDVQLLFDGGGTKWIEEMSDSDHKRNFKLSMNFGRVITSGVCDFCVEAFDGDKSMVKAEGLTLINEYQGHPSIAKLIGEGYQVITL